MYQALLLDFYGTLVAEDEAQIAVVVAAVVAASELGPSAEQVTRSWGRRFASMCRAANGAGFRRQREIEIASLAGVLAEFRAPLDAEALSATLFEYWAAPTPLPGAAELLRACPLPICIVSNIDEPELAQAIARLGWDLPHVVTSEGCRAYKPDAAPFRAALERLACEPGEVLHVGDSLGSDVAGAARVGIDVAWVNPRRRELPDGFAARPKFELGGVAELAALLASPR